MIKNVLFDLDGTLIDTTDGVLESVRFTIDKMQLVELKKEELLGFIGPPIYESFRKAYGLSDVEAQRATDIFRGYYKDNALYNANVYNGVINLLQTLINKGTNIGVATYKREDYALKILHYFCIDRYCEVMHGADNNNKLKKADIITRCVEELGATTQETIFIGDTEYDYVGARAADVPFVGVTYGFGFKKTDRVIRPELRLVDDPMEIISVL